MSTANGQVDSERTPLLDQALPNACDESRDFSKPPNDPSRRELTLIVIALFSAVFLGALDGTIVATLLTSIGSHFNEAQRSSYLGSAFLLSVCCFTPLYGRLSDIIGRKAAMLLAQAFFGVGTVLCGLAPSMNTLITARAIAGIGGGGVMTVATITLTDLIPLKKRGVYQGLGNVVAGFGAGIGGPFGGFINERYGWRWAFLCQVPVLVASFMLIMFYVNVKLEQKPQTLQQKLARIDYLGSATLVIGVGSLLVALDLKSTAGLAATHPLIWGLLLTSATFIAAFVGVEGFVSKEPIMPLHLLKQRTPLAVALSNFFVQGAGYSMLYNIPVYYTAVQLEGSGTAGLHLLPIAVFMGIGSVFAGVWMRRTGKFYYLILFGSVTLVYSYVLIASWSNNSSSFHLWFDPVPSAFGAAIVITATLIALVAAVPQEEMAVATGMSYLFRTSGQVIGVSLSGTLLQALLSKHLRERITGPGADEIIDSIRHSTTIIRSLDPITRQAATESYALSLRTIFWVQVAVALLAVLSCLPIEENPLPSTMAEQAKLEDERRRAREREQENTDDASA